MQRMAVLQRVNRMVGAQRALRSPMVNCSGKDGGWPGAQQPLSVGISVGCAYRRLLLQGAAPTGCACGSSEPLVYAIG